MTTQCTRNRWSPISLITAFGLVMMITPMNADHSRSKPVSELHVSGVAEVRLDPDLAQVRLGVTEEAPVAGDAQAAVNQVAQAILDAVEALGIDSNEIQTSRLTLHPVYEHGERRKPKVVGFRASNTVSIRVHDLTLLGPVIDGAVSAGGNEVQGIQFLLEYDDSARLQALQQAVAEAQGKAQAMAEALGQPLGRVLQAQEGGAQVRRPMYQEAMVMRASAADASTPVAQGKVTVSATVNLVYQLGPAND